MSGGKVVAALLAIPVAIGLNGWAVSVLWGWFVVPLGVPAIGLLHAYGVALLAGFVATSGASERKAIEERDAIDIWAWIIARPLTAVLFGWIVQGAM